MIDFGQVLTPPFHGLTIDRFPLTKSIMFLYTGPKKDGAQAHKSTTRPKPEHRTCVTATQPAHNLTLNDLDFAEGIPTPTHTEISTGAMVKHEQPDDLVEHMRIIHVPQTIVNQAHVQPQNPLADEFDFSESKPTDLELEIYSDKTQEAREEVSLNLKLMLLQISGYFSVDFFTLDILNIHICRYARPGDFKRNHDGYVHGLS